MSRDERLPARFEVRRLLGRGGIGAVYEAFDRERGERVAIKPLRSMTTAGLQRLETEFCDLQRIRHRNLVALKELFAYRGRRYLITELVEGEHLLARIGAAALIDGDEPVTGVGAAVSADATLARDAVRDDAVAASVRGASIVAPYLGAVPASRRRVRTAPMSRDELASLRDAFVQIAAALGVIHAARKAHGDLKPSNLMITPAGRVVVMDLGLVADTDGTATGRVQGTVAYMAPEQALGEPAGPAADWYSLGCVLYECLTGELPYRGASRDVLQAKIRGDAIALEPEAGASTLVALVERLLQRDPASRPTAAQVLEALGRSSSPQPRTLA